MFIFPLKVKIEPTMPCFLARVALEHYDKCKHEEEVSAGEPQRVLTEQS
jgi:hypothetical protein